MAKGNVFFLPSSWATAECVSVCAVVCIDVCVCVLLLCVLMCLLCAILKMAASAWPFVIVVVVVAGQNTQQTPLQLV